MYLQFDLGLIRPTWEPEAEMIRQIPNLESDDVICWYGYPDGTVEARVNQTPAGYMSHRFEKFEGHWNLIESMGRIILHE